MSSSLLKASLPHCDLHLRGDHHLFAKHIAKLAEQCLVDEVNTWPKPGLVSHIDNGSHSDMNAQTFYDSAAAIKPFFEKMTFAGVQNSAMQVLRCIGLEAEQAMLEATGGVNTHRGAIFGLGLLCAAAGLRANRSTQFDSTQTLGHIVANRWGADILPTRKKTIGLPSNGEKAFQQYGIGGAQTEAFLGFPCVYEVGLPALHLGQQLAPQDVHAARIQSCFSLIAAVEDTNLVHRGGIEGLRLAQERARDFLMKGGVGQPQWQKQAQAIHDEFIRLNLSPGGCADLLSMSIFVDHLDP